LSGKASVITEILCESPFFKDYFGFYRVGQLTSTDGLPVIFSGKLRLIAVVGRPAKKD
jgi:hypothetical protein